MIVLPQKTLPVQEIQNKTAAVLFEDYFAYFSKEHGISVLNHQTKATLFQKKYHHCYNIFKIQLNETYLIYSTRNTITVHRSFPNFDSVLETIKIPFSKAFCENYTPYISDISLNGHFLAFCIDYQYRTEFVIHDLKEQTIFWSFTKIRSKELLFERTTLCLQKDSLIFSLGDNECWLYNYQHQKKLKTFHIDQDIVEIFANSNFIAVQFEDDSVNVYDKNTFFTKDEPCLSLLNVASFLFFHQDVCCCVKKAETVVNLYMLSFDEEIQIPKALSIQTKTPQNALFLFGHDDFIGTFSKDKDDDPYLETFFILKPKKSLCLLEKMDNQKILGFYDENIDVKYHIFSFFHNLNF